MVALFRGPYTRVAFAETESAAGEAEIRLLERMTLTELRQFWTVRWGIAPTLRSVDLLRHLIAGGYRFAVSVD